MVCSLNCSNLLLLWPTLPFLAVTLPHKVKLRNPALACLSGSECAKIACTAIVVSGVLLCCALQMYLLAQDPLHTFKTSGSMWTRTFCSKGRTTPLEPKASRVRVRWGCNTILPMYLLLPGQDVDGVARNPVRPNVQDMGKEEWNGSQLPIATRDSDHCFRQSARCEQVVRAS